MKIKVVCSVWIPVLFLACAVRAQSLPPDFVLQSGRGLGGPIAFSPDGQLLASADPYGIQLIDAATQREVRFLSGAQGAPRALLFSPDGRWLISGNESSEPGAKHVIQVWDVAEGQVSKVLAGHRHPVTSLAFSADGRTLLSAGANATVIEWELQTWRELRTTSHPTGETVAGVLLSPDGRLLAEVSGQPYRQGIWETSEIKVYEATTRRVVAELGEGGTVSSMAFSPDGRWLAVNGSAWDLQKAAQPEPRATASITGSFLAIDVSGRAVAMEYANQTQGYKFALRDLSTGRSQSFDEKETEFPHRVEFSPDGRKLLIGLGSSSGLRLWDLETMREAGIVISPPAVQSGEIPLEPAAFSPDGSQLAVASEGGQIILWNAYTWVIQKRLSSDCRSLRKVSFSPRGDKVAAFCNQSGRGIQLWDLSRAEVVMELKGASSDFAFRPDGTQIAWLKGNNPGAVLQWTDVQTGSLVRSLRAPDGRFQFTKDGARIAGELAEGGQFGWSVVLGIWDAKTGSLQARIPDGGPFALSPDAAVIATGAWLHKASTGEKLRRYTMRGGAVLSVTFSPDGRRLAAGWTDSKTTVIVVWDTRSWTELAVLSGHTGGVTQLVFSPNGKQLVSASYDRTVRVWRTDSPEN